MSTDLAVGWNARACINAWNPIGRLFVSGPGYISGGVMTSNPVTPRWNWPAASPAACASQSDAVVQFLTGKASGANLLVYMDAAMGESWGSDFRAWAAGLGHTLTFAGLYSAGGPLPFNGYDPADYDAFLIDGVIDEARDAGPLQTYLTTQAGRVWAYPHGGGASVWLTAYGAQIGSMPAWALQSDMFPFDCVPLINSPHSTYLSYGVDSSPVTVGSGTATRYTLNAQPTIGGCIIWRQD
jgi:hypothetical protein